MGTRPWRPGSWRASATITGVTHAACHAARCTLHAERAKTVTHTHLHHTSSTLGLVTFLLMLVQATSLEAEVLEGDNQYLCEACCKKTDATGWQKGTAKETNRNGSTSSCTAGSCITQGSCHAGSTIALLIQSVCMTCQAYCR